MLMQQQPLSSALDSNNMNEETHTMNCSQNIDVIFRHDLRNIDGTTVCVRCGNQNPPIPGSEMIAKDWNMATDNYGQTGPSKSLYELRTNRGQHGDHACDAVPTTSPVSYKQLVERAAHFRANPDAYVADCAGTPVINTPKEVSMDTTNITPTPGMIRQHSLITKLLQHHGIDAHISDVASSWPTIGTTKPRFVHVPVKQMAQAESITSYGVKTGVTERKVNKRLKVMYAQGETEIVAPGTRNDDGVLTYTLVQPEHRNLEIGLTFNDCQIRIRHQASDHNVNDGHGVISRSGALKIAAARIINETGATDVDDILAQARKRIKGVSYVQHFSLSNHGGTKGLLYIMGDERFVRKFGTTADIVIDSENVKTEVTLKTDVALFKCFFRKPIDKVKQTPTVEIDEVGLGLETRTTIGAERMATITNELLQRNSKELAVALMQDTKRELQQLPWDDAERSEYAMEDEKLLAMQWTGALSIRTKGRLPSTMGTIKKNGKIRRTKAILSAIGAYFCGDGSYEGMPAPQDGYLGIVKRGNRVIGWTMSAATLAEHSLALDTMDADGDYVVAAARIDPNDEFNPYRAMVTRLPQSIGGGCVLKLTKEDFDFLTQTRGLIAPELIGELPYQEFQREGVYTLVPIHESKDAAGQTIESPGGTLGAIYNVSNVLKIHGWITDSVSQAYIDFMAKHDIEIPNDVYGLRFNLSEHVIDPAGDKTAMLKMLENVMWRHLRNGELIDECYRNRVEATIRNLLINHKVNRAVSSFFKPCDGEHKIYNELINRQIAVCKVFEHNLEMLANGPTSTLLNDVDGRLKYVVQELTSSINDVWQIKFRKDKEIDPKIQGEERNEIEETHYKQAIETIVNAVEAAYVEADAAPGEFTNALIHVAAFDVRRYRDDRRAPNTNHLYAWAYRSQNGAADLKAFRDSREAAVPTVLIRANGYSEVHLGPGLEYLTRKGKDGKTYVTGNYCVGTVVVADSSDVHPEADSRRLRFLGVAADGRTLVFQVLNLIKES